LITALAKGLGRLLRKIVSRIDDAVFMQSTALQLRRTDSLVATHRVENPAP
jgi:hypothetical protein